MLTSRLLVSALTTAALATGGLAAVAPSPAAADPVEITYTCTFPLLDELDVSLTLDVPDLPAELPVGVPVPDGTWDVEGVLTLPDLVLTLLLGAVGVSGSAEDFGLLLGEEDPVPLELSAPLVDLSLDGDIELPLSGSNLEFEPSVVGAQEVTFPSAFHLQLLDDLGLEALSVDCDYWGDEEPSLGTVEVVKQRSTLHSTVLTKPAKAGKKAKILVSVLDQLDKGAAGDVVASIDGTKVAEKTLRRGTAKLKIAGLPVGRHRVRLSYLGSDTVSQAVKTVTVKVVRAR